jgi:hypothetical protein
MNLLNKMLRPRLLVACERSGIVRRAFAAKGWDAWSCDLAPAKDGHHNHIQGDCLGVLDLGWDLMISHPVCTYLTCSAEWAYGDGPYHQNIKPGTLVGTERREARQRAVDFVFRLRDAPIPRKVIENPRGHLSSAWRKPDQTIQPHWFGDDASKATCLWFEGDIPLLVPTNRVPPRMVDGRPRWGNQTDSGQNKLSPSDDRAELRSETYPGFAAAMAEQWTAYILGPKTVLL